MPHARDAATIVENWSLTERRFRHLERTVLGRYLLSCHTVIYASLGLNELDCPQMRHIGVHDGLQYIPISPAFCWLPAQSSAFSHQAMSCLRWLSGGRRLRGLRQLIPYVLVVYIFGVVGITRYAKQHGYITGKQTQTGEVCERLIGAKTSWPLFHIIRCRLTSTRNPIVEIRRSWNRLISTMGFSILVRRHLFTEPESWFRRWYVAIFIFKTWCTDPDPGGISLTVFHV